MLNRLSAAKYWLALVLISLVLSVWHFGPLRGTLPALLTTVGIQVYLLGTLSARTLGLFRRPETVVIRVVWIAACGLGISIVIGAICRLLLIPLSIYLVGLHLLMIVLCFVPAHIRPIKPISRQVLPFYALLGVICVIFVVVGWQRNHLRFSGYPDQTYPVSLADWMIHRSRPEPLAYRSIAQTDVVGYWASDGLTYVYASWGWSSGASSAEIIWYVLTPLFVWLVPLAHFAVAYRVTKRTDTAAWATGITLIFALTTINSPSLLGGAWMYGQEAAFHLTTLRYFSAALLLPLALFVFFNCLRASHIRNYLMTGIIILALALIHPRQFLVVFAGLYAVLGLRWIVKPSKKRLLRLLPVALVMLPALMVPVIQYMFQLKSQITPDIVSDLAGAASISQQIIEPSMLLFHPFVILAVVFSVIAVIQLRRSLAAQYIVGTVGVMLILSYVTPIFNIILRLLGSYYGIHFVFELFYILPIGLILGIAISYALDWLEQRVRLHQVTVNSFLAGGFVAVAFITLAEPFPIPQSARDQINALDQMQAIRDIRPFDEQLLTRLAGLPITGERVVYLTPNRIANFVIESVPAAFVTGGREQDNPGYAGTERFYSANTPWLDADDIAFMQKYNVSYLVLPAESTRIPQLDMQPERFQLLEPISGYAIYSVHQPLAASSIDKIFSEMNALYQADAASSEPVDFQWGASADQSKWQAIIDEWQAQAKQTPDNDVVRYGLAFAQLMHGDQSTDAWQALSTKYPDVFLLNEMPAQVQAEQGDLQSAVDRLYGQFQQAKNEAHVLYAKALLSEPFFSKLTSEQLDSLIAASSADPNTWANLMEWYHDDELRMRVALLMSAGRWDTAALWLSHIPEVNLQPRDLVAQAALQLKDGKTDAARATLHQAIDLDWLQPHDALYRAQWTDDVNDAARAYYTLTEPSEGEISPSVITESGNIFLLNPKVEQAGKQLLLAVTFGNFTPALPPHTIVVQVVSADGKTVYQEKSLNLDMPDGVFQRLNVTLDDLTELPAQTPVVVTFSLQASDDLIYQQVQVNAVWQ